MVLPKLPELEDIKGGLAEGEVKKGSKFHSEWDCRVDLSTNHSVWIVVD